MLLRFCLVVLLSVGLGAPVAAQEAPEPDAAATTQGPTRAETGGSPTLEDILARQRGDKVDLSYRLDGAGSADAAAGIAAQLGTRGGASDSDVFLALRYGTANVSVSTSSPAAEVLIQGGGMAWLKFREGPLAKWGGMALLGMLGVLVLFYLLRGRIRIDGKLTGHKILRFNSIERFGHWLFAGSFVLLAVTGLVSIFGRQVLIPIMGHDAFAAMAAPLKWVHNNVAWAFMLGLVMVIVMWVAHNIPNRHDLVWLSKGGGLFSKGVHPPARKFNAGQKGIFWACVVLGLSISASGLALLFPFELPMFAKTFAVLNQTPIPGLFGYDSLPTRLAPHEEMQLSQAWHAIVGFIFMAVIIAHIYLGSVGMEGAFDAMGTGEVEEQWAREHHGLWVAEVEEAQARAARASAQGATPAE